MPNYKKMYFALFNAVSDSIINLQKAQRSGEEAYIREEPPVFSIAPAKPAKKKQAPKA